MPEKKKVSELVAELEQTHETLLKTATTLQIDLENARARPSLTCHVFGDPNDEQYGQKIYGERLAALHWLFAFIYDKSSNVTGVKVILQAVAVDPANNKKVEALGKSMKLEYEVI